MSCCGEPSHKTDTAQVAQYVTPFQTQPITQQPGLQPNLQWQQPNINEKGFQPQPAVGPTPPPQAHPGYGGWEKSSPNQQTTFQPYVPQGSPPPVTYPNGAMPPQQAGSPPPGSTSSPFSPYGVPVPVQTPPLARTPEQRSVPMSVTTRGPSPPSMPQQLSFAADEGKLSVSIDFGEWILGCFRSKKAEKVKLHVRSGTTFSGVVSFEVRFSSPLPDWRDHPRHMDLPASPPARCSRS